jgi:hypothetical protein
MVLDGDRVKAQVSITCVPWVFMTLIVCPAAKGVAIPCFAGIVVREDIARYIFCMFFEAEFDPKVEKKANLYYIISKIDF